MDKQHPFLDNSVERGDFFRHGRCCFAVLIIRTHFPLQLLEYYSGFFNISQINDDQPINSSTTGFKLIHWTRSVLDAKISVWLRYD